MVTRAATGAAIEPVVWGTGRYANH
jgi:hypothetical protein